jgi:hypothetical protein
MSEYINLLVVALFFAASYYLGHSTGTAKGRALGWLEHYEQQAAADKAKRDARGRWRKQQ